MKLYFIASVLAFFVITLSTGQNLLPHIGVTEQPQPNDQICQIPIADVNFAEVGYYVGDLVHDFTLYTIEGVEVTLSSVLSNGKPVLLVNGNYTCWRFRDEIEAINEVAEYYSDQIETYVVYTVEAHPHIDASPYSGNVWTGERNFTDDVLLRQPTTYGERLANIDSMLVRDELVPDILVDGPCNYWWQQYGPSPNNAYLIDTDGVVQMRHTWANQVPGTFWCDLSEYFGQYNENCEDIGSNGTFEVTFVEPEENTAYGYPGETIIIPTLIHNQSATDYVFVEILRQTEYVPDDWQTSLCVDVCLSPSVSSTVTAIPPGGTQSFQFYFFTSEIEGIGYSTVRFMNSEGANNYQLIEFVAVTGVPTGLEDQGSSEWRVFPNPTRDIVYLETTTFDLGSMYSVHASDGRIVQTAQISSMRQLIDLKGLPSGIYFIRLENASYDVQRIVKR